MTNPWIMTGVAVLDAAAGGWVGYIIGRRPLTPEQVYKLMGRVVNLEAMEEQEKLNKVRMARNHVKSTRLDGGPNARVTKMRISRRGRRR
jgi:membrane protein YqaA with SNARE-associated domain